MKNNNLSPKILLYGDSILIESLTSKLQKIEGWEARRIKSGEITAVGDADFIVVDLCDGTTANALFMLSALPATMLIGLDSIANTITVLTGRAHSPRSTQDVLNELKKAM
jgi:hypothetical protein